MDNKAFFSELLGLHAPWYITDVSLDKENERVDIYVQHTKGIRFPCPVCETFCSVYDHTDEREFRHLNVLQMTSWIHVRVPRINCAEHGVQQITHGLAEKNGKTTYEFEGLAIALLHECSVESVRRLLDIDWHTCYQIQERAVLRGMERKPNGIPSRIGVDEKSFAKGHKYETLVYNHERGTVEYVCDDRKQAILESYFRQFTHQQREQVQTITMDMWDPYIAATRLWIPEADDKIVFDRYHAMKQVVDAVDAVRRQEHKSLMADGIDILKGSKYYWLYSHDNMSSSQKEKFKPLQQWDLKVGRAWAMKENIRHMWDYRYTAWMEKFFKKWYFWATHSRLDPIVKAAKTLKRYLKNILTYAKHRITNALGESVNSRIEKVKRLACGYRNRAHYRTAIYFHCGGLDLLPKRSTIPMQIISS